MALPSPVQAAWVSTLSRGPGAGFLNPTYTATGTATAAGSWIFVVDMYYGASTLVGTITSITDNVGNTYVRGNNLAASMAGYYNLNFWYCANATAGATTVTTHYSESTSGTTQVHLMYVIEYPLPATSSIDKQAINNGQTTSLNSGNTAALASSAEFVFGYGFFGQATGSGTVPTTPNPSSDFTHTANITTTTNLFFSDGISPSAAAVNASYTGVGATNPKWICGVATFPIPSGFNKSNGPLLTFEKLDKEKPALRLYRQRDLDLGDGDLLLGHYRRLRVA